MWEFFLAALANFNCCERPTWPQRLASDVRRRGLGRRLLLAWVRHGVTEPDANGGRRLSRLNVFLRRRGAPAASTWTTRRRTSCPRGTEDRALVCAGDGFSIPGTRSARARSAPRPSVLAIRAGVLGREIPKPRARAAVDRAGNKPKPHLAQLGFRDAAGAAARLAAVRSGRAATPACRRPARARFDALIPGVHRAIGGPGGPGRGPRAQS